MGVFVKRSRFEAPASEVYAWHARPGAFERLNPPWEPAEVVVRGHGIDNGSRMVLRVSAGPLLVPWIAEHRDVTPGRGFRDVQLHGPFASWEHDHRVEPRGPEQAELEDRIRFRLPGGAAGALGGRLVARKLERMFAYRHRTLAADLADHAACRGGLAMKVAVTGATGLVGTALGSYLEAGGHAVTRLVRGRPGRDEAAWDPARGVIDAQLLEGVDAVVHLAGESIADGRWTADKKRRIRDSRVGGTRLLASALARLRRKPRTLLCASAVGFYGDRGEELLTESSCVGDGFLPEVCSQWEGAAAPAAEAGIRVVHLRIGLVLTPLGGALGRMLVPFRIGVGGRMGSGRQWMSWIAIDDLLSAIHHVLADEELRGPVNAVAPHPVTNAEFARTLGSVLGRPAVAPLPGVAARLAFGEMADALLLSSARVQPEKLLNAGFSFRYPRLDGALDHLLGRRAS